MTLQIPRVPTVTKGFHFSGVEEHQAKQDISKEIVDTLRWMQKNTLVPGYQEMLGKFVAAVPCTSGVRDFARLPYPASGPRDLRGTSKLGCVYTVCSWVVQLFWDMQIDGIDNSIPIRGYLALLRLVWAKGVDKCIMVGSPREGWVLGVPV